MSSSGTNITFQLQPSKSGFLLSRRALGKLVGGYGMVGRCKSTEQIPYEHRQLQIPVGVGMDARRRLVRLLGFIMPLFFRDFDTALMNTQQSIIYHLLCQPTS